jgi:outer membrane protein
MNRISIIINAILGIGLIVLYYLHFKGAPQNDQPIIVPPKIKVKPSHLVYINTDSLMDQYDYVKDMRNELEKERNQAENEFQTKYTKLENEANNLREIYEKLSQDEAMKQQQDIAMKEQKLNEFREQMQEKLMKNEQDKNEKMLKSISDFLQKNYQKTGYTYILGYQHGGGILYAKDSLNITHEVIEGLNAQYRANKK